MAKEIVLYATLPVQQRVIDSPARYKLVRAGRRGSKSRLGLFAAFMGHGPEVDGVPMWRGMRHGGEILWLAKDFPQGRAIWRQEIIPRFDGAQGCAVEKQDRRVVVSSRGSLEMRTYENIESIRGGRYDGMIVDEAAHIDLEYAWTEILRPTLIDRIGWAIFPSTPNFGKDGNEKRPYGPSYFNLLCQMELEGKL